MLLGYLSKKSCGIGLCFGQSFLPLPCFCLVLIVHDVWMLKLLGCYGSLEGLMGTRTERNQDKGYVGVRELS